MARRFYVSGYKKGNIGVLESVLFAVYVIAAIAVYGLGSVNLSWISDFSIWIVVVSALSIVALDKQARGKQNIAVLEIVALMVAIGLPLAAAGYLTSLGVDISEYLTNSTNAFIMLFVSVAALIIAAKQD